VSETRRPLQVAVISHLYPSRTRGSYGVFVYEQSRALVDSGCELTAIAVPVPRAPWPLPHLSATWRRYAETETTRVDFGSVPVEFPRYLSLPRKMLRSESAKSAAAAIARSSNVSHAFGRADVIVAHTALLDGAIARSIAARLGVPYVVFVHGEDLYQNASADKPRLRAQVHGVLSGASTVIAVSDVVRDGLACEFPDLARVVVLPNGVDTELFSPHESRAAGSGASTAESATPLRVLSAGHLVTRKAHEFVIRAIAALTLDGVDVRYTIAGDGPLRPALEALAADLGLADRVTFSGAYRHEQLPGLLHDTDLFALPSWDEAFGVVYLEALACGVPVIAASDGGAATFVDEGIDGYLVSPRNVDALTATMRRFANLGTAEKGAMSTAARAKALNFTWKRNAESLMEILAEVVASPEPTSPE